MTISYDFQKNMVMPKVPDQAAYHRRQLYTYNFTIREGTSKTKQYIRIIAGTEVESSK